MLTPTTSNLIKTSDYIVAKLGWIRGGNAGFDIFSKRMLQMGHLDS